MRASRTRTTHAPRLYLALLLLMVWLPIPLGSNRVWAWAPMEVVVYLMAALWLWGYARGRLMVSSAFRRAAPVLILFGLWLGYGLVQLVPLPLSVLATLSPNTAELYAQAERAPHLAGAPLVASPDRPPSLAPKPVSTADDARVPSAKPGDPEAGSPDHLSSTSAASISTQTQLWRPLSLDPRASLANWLKSLAYVLLFALTLLLVDSRQRLRALAYVLLCTALGEAVYGSLLAASERSVATGTFINRNHFASYIVMGLCVGIGLLIASTGQASTRRSWRQRLRNMTRVILSYRAPIRIALAIMVIALVLTHSRMGNTSFFISLLLVGGLALGLLKDSPRPVILLISSLIVIDIVIIGSWVGIERVKERIEETRLHTEKRDEVDIYSFELWQDYPLFGTGAGSYYGVFPRYREADLEDQFYDHAHNDYLEFLIEYGAIGTALLAAIVLLTLWHAINAQRRRRDLLLRGMGLTATMAITAMLIHATVEFNLQIPANAATFTVLLAMGWLARYSDLAPPGRSGAPAANLLPSVAQSTIMLEYSHT